MQVKITLSNGKELIILTDAPTLKDFMKEFTMVVSHVFTGETEYMKKHDKFLEINGIYIRYSEIVVIEEVTQ